MHLLPQHDYLMIRTLELLVQLLRIGDRIWLAFEPSNRSKCVSSFAIKRLQVKVSHWWGRPSPPTMYGIQRSLGVPPVSLWRSVSVRFWAAAACLLTACADPAIQLHYHSEPLCDAPHSPTKTKTDRWRHLYLFTYRVRGNCAHKCKH